MYVYMYLHTQICMCVGGLPTVQDMIVVPQSFLGQNSNFSHVAKGALWVHVMVAGLGKQ